ncbi:MAG: FixH family protein [Planctomycetes bacterium]|nr:FixH family protein [Planctomycetota bacterium]
MAILISIAGCGQPKASGTSQTARSQEGASPSKSPGEPVKLFDAEKTYRIEFSPDPSPIGTSAPFSLHVNVTRASTGEPVGEEASLVVDAAMPEHRHGMNTQPRVSRVGRGQFDVEGMLLHMPGRWEIYFDVTEGAVTRRATLQLELE